MFAVARFGCNGSCTPSHDAREALLSYFGNKIHLYLTKLGKSGVSVCVQGCMHADMVKVGLVVLCLSADVLSKLSKTYCVNEQGPKQVCALA